MVAGISDLSTVGCVAGDDAALRSRAIGGGIVAVDAEAGASEHLVGRVGVENDGGESGVRGIDQSGHEIAALRTRSDVMLVLQTRIVYAGPVAGISIEHGHSVAGE